MSDTDTIAAIATPHGKSALAVIRISGPKAIEIGARCIKEKLLFAESPARYLQIYSAIDPDSESILDEITAIKYEAPRSFTGEHMVEIVCHGGPIIMREIAGVLLRAGARAARKGEFTRRALANGKIDLLRAEAIGGLIESDSEAELSCAQKLYGSISKEVFAWRDRMIELIARVEASIEFGEEEHVVENSDNGVRPLNQFINELEQDLKKREKISSMEDRVRILIAGPTNAGKSTLFNAILGYGRAIVHEEPGTTRDLVSERVWIKKHEVQLIDSAGIRETGSVVEREGIQRSRSAFTDAAIIIWVTAADEPMAGWEEEELRKLQGKRILCVINKVDLALGERKLEFFKKLDIKAILVSLKEGLNSEKIFEELSSLTDALIEKIEIPDIFLNKRHEQIGRELLRELCDAKKAWGQREIAAYHLHRCLSLIDELLGRTDNEEILNRIFDNFCIGK